MTLVDPTAGRAFIWIVTSFLFLSILSGGMCLLMYMILPETETTAWLPIIGLSLVCLPWFFWFLTFFYRIISRACGFRVSIGIGLGEGANVANNVNANNNASAEFTQGNERDRDNEESDNQKRSSSSPNSSVASRESEMPLAITMAS